jgi:hypothetical protein
MNSINIKKAYSFKEKIPQILFGILISFVILTYIVSLMAFVSPSEEQRWDTSIQTLSTTSYYANEDVSITGLLTEGTDFILNGEYFSFTSSETITWIITIIDPSNAPVYYSDGTISDAQGDIVLSPITYTIPSNPTLGTYTIKVFVITEYLPTGEIRINQVNEETFEVIS